MIKDLYWWNFSKNINISCLLCFTVTYHPLLRINSSLFYKNKNHKIKYSNYAFYIIMLLFALFQPSFLEHPKDWHHWRALGKHGLETTTTIKQKSPHHSRNKGWIKKTVVLRFLETLLYFFPTKNKEHAQNKPECICS